MNFSNLIGSSVGFIHLTASIIALITGLFILVSKKGTAPHKRIGYTYSISMIVLNVTAFMIYRLYGKFGIFHWFAVMSCLTLFAGLYPVIAKRTKNYLVSHFRFMYWSVIGLYCAFMAEVFSRLPNIILTETGKPMVVFYKMIGVAIGITMFIGVGFFIKYKPKWTKQYSQN